MAEIKITFQTDGQAFDGYYRGIEIARILRKIANEYESCSYINEKIYDLNGNMIGTVKDIK